LELPPFYGISRLFAVYEAKDYKDQPGSAVNLLRQNVDGVTFWIEKDADGDSTFILNADCLDIKKAVYNPIASFAAGDYVILAHIFGFDRGSFDLDQDFRVVLTRNRNPSEAGDTTVRDNNYARRWNGVTVPATGVAAQVIASTGQPLVIPAPAPSGEEIGISYSRQPYQGDAWGSQTIYQDSAQQVGPLTAGNMYTLVTTSLNQSGLTRPNQKPLEVLASLKFKTTLGTGRIAGDTMNVEDLDFRNIGYEDPTGFPPTSAAPPRPRTLVGFELQEYDGSVAFLGVGSIGTEYLGCTDRLPLGATFRDKDFRGDPAGSTGQAFQYQGECAPGLFLGSLAANNSLEQDEINVSTSSVGSGAPGEIVVQVDGAPGNYATLTNFRTNRGGSLFMASGPHPGGDFASTGELVAPEVTSNVLSGVAMLVRNQVTSVGGSEVSAGDELMMLIVTTGQRLVNTGAAPLQATLISTSGTGEGLSAADLYRIQGHPLMRDNEKTEIDPNTITLAQPSGFDLGQVN
jgi:hypothetical protein